MRPLTEDATFLLLWVAEAMATSHGVHVGSTTTMPEAIRHGGVTYTHDPRRSEDLRSCLRKFARLADRGYVHQRKAWWGASRRLPTSAIYEITTEGVRALDGPECATALCALAAHTDAERLRIKRLHEEEDA